MYRCEGRAQNNSGVGTVIAAIVEKVQVEDGEAQGEFCKCEGISGRSFSFFFFIFIIFFSPFFFLFN